MASSGSSLSIDRGACSDASIGVPAAVVIRKLSPIARSCLSAKD